MCSQQVKPGLTGMSICLCVYPPLFLWQYIHQQEQGRVTPSPLERVSGLASHQAHTPDDRPFLQHLVHICMLLACGALDN